MPGSGKTLWLKEVNLTPPNTYQIKTSKLKHGRHSGRSLILSYQVLQETFTEEVVGIRSQAVVMSEILTTDNTRRTRT